MGYNLETHKETNMRGLAALLLITTIGLAASPQVGTPSAAFHSVSYVEVAPSGKTAAVAALKAYQSANRTQDGFVRIEAFEQTGRPGHLVYIESWRDQEAFDKRSTQKQLVDALQPIRFSNIDQRPYKNLSLAAPGRTARDTVYVITHVDATPSPQLPTMLQKFAEDSRRDDGNLRFDVILHTMRANHLTVIEAWRNRKALDDHAAAAHTKEFREAFGPMAGSPLDERVFEALEL
jgi:quinol monooxygenase YgiN